MNAETGEGTIFEEDDKEISEDSHHLVYITLRSILQIQPKQEKTKKKAFWKICWNQMAKRTINSWDAEKSLYWNAINFCQIDQSQPSKYSV